MNERFCQNIGEPNCPCVRGLDPGDPPPFCVLNPVWVDLPAPPRIHYCYIGRQIMATRASLQQAREAFEKEGETNA